MLDARCDSSAELCITAPNRIPRNSRNRNAVHLRRMQCQRPPPRRCRNHRFRPTAAGGRVEDRPL